MRLKRLHHFLFLVLLLTSCWPETGGRLFNKDTENLTAKVRRGVQHDFQRDFLHAKGQWVQSVQERNESFSIDEQDAILFQYIIANLIQSLQQSISVVSSMIRICGDTLAGVMSGMVKATGGLLNLASKVLYYVSAKLEATQEHSPAFLGNFSANCAFGLKQAAPILHYAGEACIYSGEILESMTLGLGEAVQDSFWGLEVVSNSSNVIISFLLQIDEVDSIASMRKRIAEIASASLPSSPNDDIGTSEMVTSAEASLTNANTTPSSSSPSRHIRNILHTRPHIELNTHSVDPHNKPHTSSIEVKLGKEWIAPDATVISLHDETDTATTSNIVTDDPNTDNKEHTSNTNHSYTTYNATNLVLNVRHVWSILVNKTSSIAKQLTNHTQGVYLADAASSTIAPEDSADLDDSIEEPIPPITNSYTYVVQELTILLSDYLVYTLSLSYRILHGLTILSIQLYTTVIAAQQTESSQGAFFLLALLATYIISVIPFQSMCRKIVSLLFFITLVYCSFITTEQIQRGKLIHNTSVQSAHDLLLQQAHQRHQRAVNPKLYDNVIRDSSSLYSEFAEISVDGDVYVQSDDVITVPHYEHTPTQDVYSNINHHVNQQHTIHTTSITNTSQSIPEVTTNTTTTLLFNDAIWLNTLLTSLWVINDAHFNTQGLGAYLNEVYAEYVNIELNNIPPSVANIRLKSFDLGRAAPLFKGVRVFRVRDHLCMKQHINSEFNVGMRDDTSSPVRSDNNTDLNNTGSNANGSISSLQAHDTILANLWQSIENWGTDSISSNNNNETMPSNSNNDDDSNTNKGSKEGNEGPNVSTSAASDPTTPTTPTPTASTTATPILPSTTPASPSTAESVPSALLAPYKHLLSQFNADCDSLMIEMDTIFLSSDMNIVLSLRQALKSALPEITATLSEVSLSGQLRLKVKLTPDYPFVGDGQLSFLSAPQLGFSLNSLGGIELSSVPYAFYWVNSSMHYVLEQYTAPKYMELDLRHTLCATCDLPLVPAHDIVKVLKHGVSTAVERLKLAAVKARALWAKVDQSGRKWAVHLHHAFSLAQHHLQHHLQQGMQHVQQTIDAHTARTLSEGQDSTNGGGSSSEGSEVSSGDGSGEGPITKKGEADNDRALHFTRYKSFDTIEESDMHPELKSEEINKRNGGKELISQASALWKKGQTKLKEAMKNIGNDRSVNELVYML